MEGTAGYKNEEPKGVQKKEQGCDDKKLDGAAIDKKATPRGNEETVTTQRIKR